MKCAVNSCDCQSSAPVWGNPKALHVIKKAQNNALKMPVQQFLEVIYEFKRKDL
jgi:hypothetical protein